MRGCDAGQKAKQFIKEYGIHEMSYAGLKNVIETQGYTVVEYNHIFNDENISALIDALKLSDSIIRSRGFTYADRNHRIVFVHEDLSAEEKLLVLAHEEGHIYCGHMSSGSIIGKDVQDEYTANEFAHYLLNPGKSYRLANLIRSHKKGVIICSICLLVLIAASITFTAVNKEKQYYGEYYTTESGNKYHKKDCIYVKNKDNVRRLTREQYENGEYEPCKTCLP